MKMIFVIAAGIAAAFAPLTQAADPLCRALTIPSEIELPAGELVLADLFPSSACSQFVRAARQIHLGRVPLAGSPRVFTGDEVRALLQRLNDKEKLRVELQKIPERITVRRKDGQRTNAAPRPTVSRSAVQSPKSHSHVASSASATEGAVRPGQTVDLIWDQDGIRLVVPALCLDRGRVGSEVRARIRNGGVVVRAIVESASSVRAVS